MKKILIICLFVVLALSACGSNAPAATPTATSVPTAAATATEAATAAPAVTPTITSTFVPTLSYPPEGYGPTNFPAGVDPLTGLTVADPALLQRRPMLIQIGNLPRDVRPQWGLSLADIAFEYYTETGITRFSGIFYGKDASMVGPIRSGRFIDDYLVSGYKAVFAFGSAYVVEMQRFMSSDFANRMVVEAPYTPLKRYDPNGVNYLVVNTADLSAYATLRGINQPQSLNNMLFKLQPPTGGQPGTQVYIHYSSSVYNRWDYDQGTGKYLRFADTTDVTEVGQAEQYAQLTDRLNGQPIAFDNVVVLYVENKLFSRDIYDILLTGSGDGYAYRDGQAYQVKWQRNASDIISLTNPDGTPFAYKPGTTFYEVIGLASTMAQNGPSWRFTHQMP